MQGTARNPVLREREGGPLHLAEPGAMLSLRAVGSPGAVLRMVT